MLWPEAGAGDPPRPHRLAVYWRAAGLRDAPAVCELLVPGGVLHLNATAACVWLAIDGSRDEAALAAVLRDACPGLDAATAAAAVDELLAALAAAGAVVRAWTPLDPWPAPRLPPTGARAPGG